MSGPLVIEGTYFAAGTSRAVPADLEVPQLDDKACRVLPHAGPPLRAEISALSDRIGAVDRRVELADGGVFVTADNASVDRLTSVRGGFFSRMSGLEALHPRLLAFVVIAVLIVFAAVRYGLPVAAQAAAWATPPKVVEWMDTSARATLDRLFFSNTGVPEARRERIQAGFDRLVAASDHEGPLRLLFRDGGRMGPNALALPGGTVMVTDQLVAIASDDELIAVLAHEIAHVDRQHSLQQMYRALGFAGFIAVIAGDLGAVAEELLGGGGVLLAMAASREMELEADAEGVLLLRKVGVDPHNLSTVLDKLYKAVCGDLPGGLEACEKTGWFSSHPGGEQRRLALERLTGRR